MKKIVILVAALLASNPANAEKSEEDIIDSLCTLVGSRAASVFYDRLLGVDIFAARKAVDTDFVELPEVKGIMNEIVMDTYGQILRIGTEAQLAQAKDFKAKWAYRCFQRYGD